MECKLRTRSVKIAQVLGNVLMRCWAVTCLASMLCLILYWVYGCLWAIMLLIFVTTGVLYYSEDFLLFHPDMPAHSRVFVPVPSMFGLPYENLYVRSADGTRLHLYFIRQPGPVSARAPTVLFLHGNAGNMGHRLQNVLGLYQQLQCNVLMLEYRGYGLSQGSPSEHGLYADARAALDYLSSRSDINHAEVVVFGRSLGGAVAIDVAAQPEYAQKIWCLVVENTFTSIPDMARVLIGWRLLQYLPRFLYKNKDAMLVERAMISAQSSAINDREQTHQHSGDFTACFLCQFLSAEKVGRVTAPTLFVSGLADILVPPRMMSELHGLCRAHRQLLQLETGTHNDTWTCPGYYHALANFLRDARARRGAAPAPPPPSPSTRIEHV